MIHSPDSQYSGLSVAQSPAILPVVIHSSPDRLEGLDRSGP